MKTFAYGMKTLLVDFIRCFVPLMGTILWMQGCMKSLNPQDKESSLDGGSGAIDAVSVEHPLTPLAQKIREKSLVALKEIYKKNLSPDQLKLSAGDGGLPQPVAEAILEVLKSQSSGGDVSSEKYPCKINSNLIKPYEVLYALQRAGLGPMTSDDKLGELSRFLTNKRWMDVLGYPLKSTELMIALEKWFTRLERENPREVGIPEVSRSLGLKKVTLPDRYFDFATFDRDMFPNPGNLETHVSWINHILKKNEVPLMDKNQRQLRCFGAGIVTRLIFVKNPNEGYNYSNFFESLRNVDVFEYVKAIESKNFISEHRPERNVDTKSLVNYINTKNQIDTLVINLSFPTDSMRRSGFFGQVDVPILKSLSDPVRNRIRTIVFDLWGLTKVIEEDSCSFRLLKPEAVTSLLTEVKRLLPQAVNFGVDDTHYTCKYDHKSIDVDLVQSVIQGIDKLGAEKLLLETHNRNKILDNFPTLNKIKSVKIQVDSSQNKRCGYGMSEFKLSNLMSSLKNVKNIWFQDATDGVNTEKLNDLYESWKKSSTHSKLEKIRFSCTEGLSSGTSQKTIDLPYTHFPSLRTIVSENCNLNLPTSPLILKKIILGNPNGVQWIPRSDIEELVSEKSGLQ